jgi:4-hydroxy-tetrahydrodipicolinate reductase
MIEVIVCGAAGRMGGGIIQRVLTSEDLRLVGAVEAAGHSAVGREVGEGIRIQDDLAQAFTAGSVVVDFTAPAATMMHLEFLAGQPAHVVVGTTGFTADQSRRIREIGARLPLVQSHNYGLGMNFFYTLVEQATRLLADRFDIEIVEFHGGEKKDAPSGTAGTIARKIAKARGLKIEEVAVYGRKGLRDTVRRREEIGISSVRGGTYKSDHTVIFAGAGERIEMTHREESPQTLVEGVLQAIRYVHGKAPGYYGMEDVLKLGQQG